MRLQAKNLLLYKPFFVLLYIFGIIVCVPISLLVWFIRRKFNEKSVAGWNGGSDRCTIGMIRHFAAGGHKVVWLTTMIDDYWANEDFGGVDIHQVRLPLHPGDWFSQNVALGYHLLFSDLKPDLIIVDHSASCVPMLKWRFPQSRVLFYCHFPQQLVTPSRFFLYRWYSGLIGLIEAKLYESADVVMVNSQFTASQFRSVMPSISNDKIRVVYPPCDVDSLSVSGGQPVSRKARAQNSRYIFLSMNRFWPEKRLDIILDAAAILKKKGLAPRIQLAGSVMPHIPESRIYYELLRFKCAELGVESMVEFIPSPSEEEKFFLYRQCDSALYTPELEHFGIVPIEALEQRRPVIVVDSGGPAETVIEDVTGTKIKKPCGKLLAAAMLAHMKKEVWGELDLDEKYVHQRLRFESDFSLKGFGRRIDDALITMFPPSMYTPLPPVATLPPLPVSPFPLEPLMPMPSPPPSPSPPHGLELPNIKVIHHPQMHSDGGKGVKKFLSASSKIPQKRFPLADRKHA